MINFFVCIDKCVCGLCFDVERVLSREDKLVDVLARWGPYRDEVGFYIRQSKLDHGQGMYSSLN